MGRRPEPTPADATREIGVSLTAVSRVLNNRDYLSQATKDKVARAIKTLGYRPGQVARALHGRRTYTTRLIIPTVALPFFGGIAVAIESALAESDYRVLICNSLDRLDRERDYLNFLIDNHVNSIVFGVHSRDLGKYQSARMPIVTIDRSLSPRIPNVRCDNEIGGRLATERLLVGDS